MIFPIKRPFSRTFPLNETKYLGSRYSLYIYHGKGWDIDKDTFQGIISTWCQV